MKGYEITGDAGGGWRSRVRLFAVLSLQDMRQRFAGSRLGLLWLVLQPLFYLALMTVVFFGVLEVRFGGQGLGAYALALLSGLAAWLGCNEGLSRAAVSLVERSHLIRNFPIPRIFVPLVPLVGAVIYQAVFLAVLLLAQSWRGGLSLQAPLLLAALALEVLLLSGLAWLAAAVTVLYRDVHYLLTFVLMAWLYVTPIFYPVEVVPERLAPFLIYMNPLTLLVIVFRSGVLGGPVESGVWIVLAAEAAACAAAGYFFFRRIESALTDLL